MSYADEARELDGAVSSAIDRWSRDDVELSDQQFNELALRIFAHQLAYNQPYADFCAAQGVTARALPEHWHQIPPVPAAAFKEAALCTFDPARAALVFETSGTTAEKAGRHYLETSKLYDAALLSAFDRFMLPDRQSLRYLNFVPNPAQHPHSSLGYMVGRVSMERGDRATSWYIEGDGLNIDAFLGDLEAAVEHDRPVCLTATAFALVHLMDALKERKRYFALPNGSRLMETGGFKGRSRFVEREELYFRVAERLGMTRSVMIAEYGMTELCSQYYDDVLLLMRDDVASSRTRYKLAPTWLRSRVVGPDGRDLPDTTVGALVHVDLANRSSCVAVATEDLGARFDDGLVLIGREAGAQLRGCSLTAEDLVTR
jgi:hypothetical protein